MKKCIHGINLKKYVCVDCETIPKIEGGRMDRDKFLTEAMGECWHEAGDKRRISGGKAQRDCICGESSYWENITTEKTPKYRFLSNDFSTWEGFGKLWEWAVKQEWWYQLAPWVVCNWKEGGQEGMVKQAYINPDTFANALYKYLKERGE